VIHDHSGRCERLLQNEEIVEIVLDELRVKTLRLAADPGEYVTMKAAPAYPVLGKRFGKRVPEIAGLIGNLDPAALGEFLREGTLCLDTAEGEVTLEREDMTVSAEGVPPWGGRFEHGVVVALNLSIDDALRLEGAAREIVNRLQNLRKKAGFEVSDRIGIRYRGGEMADRAFGAQGEFIQRETLATTVEKGEAAWKDRVELEIDGEVITLCIKRESD
jgi:isoleucyl-tRNA synthetase